MEIPDPAPFVDRFECEVDDFLAWRKKWMEPHPGMHLRDDEFYMHRGNIPEHWITLAATLLEQQKNVNAVMLAAIDSLKKQIGRLEAD